MPTDLLDVRAVEAFGVAPTSNAANIPLEELRDRPYELPPPGCRIRVAETGEEARAAVKLLAEMGRCGDIASAQPGKPFGDRYRLWAASPLLDVAGAAPAGRALCLACGVGREAVMLAAAGWCVTAVDVLPDAIERGRHLERTYVPAGSAPIQWLVADLRQPLPPNLGEFDLVTQFFFADPATAKRTARHLASSGSALLEAFSEGHWINLGRSRPDRILRPDEWASPYQVLYCEGWHDGRHSLRMVVRNPDHQAAIRD
ncbi:MAG: methyltransferase domain-containing protein [Fimbriimonadaceae bacterium]